MHEKLIEYAFNTEFASGKVCAEKVAERVRSCSGDRRCSLFFCAAALGYPGICSAIVEYRRKRYYVEFSTPNNAFVVRAAAHTI